MKTSKTGSIGGHRFIKGEVDIFTLPPVHRMARTLDFFITLSHNTQQQQPQNSALINIEHTTLYIISIVPDEPPFPSSPSHSTLGTPPPTFHQSLAPTTRLCNLVRSRRFQTVGWTRHPRCRPQGRFEQSPRDLSRSGTFV